MANCITIISPKYDGSLVPSNIVVDTNIFIDLIDPKSKHIKPAEHFFKQSAANNTNLYITGLIYSELVHRIQVVLTNEAAIVNGIDTSDDKYDRPYGIKLLQKDIEAIDPAYFASLHVKREAILSSFLDMAEVLPDGDSFELSNRSMYLQKKFSGCIESRDAAILTTANDYGINTIATGDYGYTKVNSINIIALPKGKYLYERSTNNHVEWTDLFEDL